MSNSKHTPGKWEFGGRSSWEVYADDGTSICTVHAAEDWQDGLLDVRHERNIAVANARLIATAPIGLELAEAVLTAEIQMPPAIVRLARRIVAAAARSHPASRRGAMPQPGPTEK